MKITITTASGVVVDVLEDGDDFSAEAFMRDHDYDVLIVLPQIREAVRRALVEQENESSRGV